MTNLLRMVEQGRLDELMAIVSVDDIALAWCRYEEQDREGADLADPDWWAIELWLSREWWQRRELVREGLLALFHRASSPDLLASVAAGPLEGFISGDESDLAWLEYHAKLSDQLREALGRVWIWDQPDGVRRRIERAAESPLPRPREG